MSTVPLRALRLGRVEYDVALERMRAFTAARAPETPDEVWLLEHPPVYTLGVRARHRLFNVLKEDPSYYPSPLGRGAGLGETATISAKLSPRPDPLPIGEGTRQIPVCVTDRGGDVTYHGPGQPVIYVLLDLERRGLGIHALVRMLEQAVIDTLAELGIAGERRAGAPGVYVGERKIASLGLRVRAGRTYHGLAFNARMDLTPFHAIEPCGYPGLRMAQLAEWRPEIDSAEAGERLLGQVLRLLGYTEPSLRPGNPCADAHRFDA